ADAHSDVSYGKRASPIAAPLLTLSIAVMVVVLASFWCCWPRRCHATAPHEPSALPAWRTISFAANLDFRAGLFSLSSNRILGFFPMRIQHHAAFDVIDPLLR